MMMAVRPRAASGHAQGPAPTQAQALALAPASGRRHSADGVAVAFPATCEGYVRLKKRGALTWSTRFLVLRGAQLTVFYAKEDSGRGSARGRLGRPPVCAAQLVGGRVAPTPEFALEFALADGREWLGRVFSRADVAAWATAFHRLAADRASSEEVARALELPRASDGGRGSSSAGRTSSAGRSSGGDRPSSEGRASEGRRRVSFHNSVLVRTIPALAPGQAGELFYSKKEVAQFSAQAASLRCRTGDAVASAFSFRRRHVE